MKSNFSATLLYIYTCTYIYVPEYSEELINFRVSREEWPLTQLYRRRESGHKVPHFMRRVLAPYPID